MTHNDNGPGLGQNYWEMAVSTFGWKVFFWPKTVSPPKEYPKLLKGWHLFRKRVLFYLHNLLLSRTWFESRSALFFGPQNSTHRTPILVNSPFVALGETVHFPPWDRFFDFPFWSYSSFRKNNPVDPSKSLPPPHCTVGAPSASNSPSALSYKNDGSLIHEGNI